MPELSPSEKSNRIRSKNKAVSDPARKKSWTGFFTSPRSRLAWGLLFIIIGVLLEIAFLSYWFTGASDQSAIDRLDDESIRDVGVAIDNILGVFGAVTAHFFIYRWFGLAAIFLPIIPIIVGWKLVTDLELLPLARISREVIFFTLWLSTVLGYVVMMGQTEASLSYISGGFGYTVNALLFSLLKFGSFIPIILAFVLYVIFSYNVTSISLGRKRDEEDLQKYAMEEEPAVEKPFDGQRVAKTVMPKFDIDFDKPELPKESTTSAEDSKSEDSSRTLNTPLSNPPLEVVDSTESNLPPVPNGTALTLDFDRNEDGDLLRSTPIVTDSEEEVSEQILRDFGQYDPTLELPTFTPPKLELLNEGDDDRQEKVSQDELEGNKARIVETLASYGINIAKIKATIGPTVTLYEIIPEAGIRISKIQNLEKDIALSLAALGIRIIAPMPGRGTIGIEVPNKRREVVFIRSMLGSEKFLKANLDLPIIMGKTISNEIHIVDLAKMPHLLMAGATGQGKSVGLNVLLASLIYKKHPAQLKFVLVDPKKVELTLFNKLERHYLAKLPNSEEAIITDTKKVIYTLNSLCIEMDNRYNLLKDGAVRNIKEYNAKFVQRRLNPEKGHRFMPYIVLVIDELSDLMMTAGKEVETPIARLAQLARAVGIHLVVATQRPSVKVITGLIKANFPARLSYRVTSSIDSRTILDTGGAEQLVGQGDMLLSVNSDILRLQCPFIDTREVEEICEFIGSQRGYDEAYALPEYEGNEGGELKDNIDIDDFDPLLSDAARLIVVNQQGSTSLIQRKMKLGYNRAGRIMDQLELIGVVGPFTGSKAREVLFHDLENLEQHIRSMALA